MPTPTLTIAFLALALGGATDSHVAPAQCANSPADIEAIKENVRALFAGLTKDDAEGVRRLLTPSFHSYDAGKRYSGPELSAVVEKAHKEGVTLEWNIGVIDVQIDCNMAWATWDNVGKAGKAGAVVPVYWLESGVFRRQGGRWLMDFLHSSRGK